MSLLPKPKRTTRFVLLGMAGLMLASGATIATALTVIEHAVEQRSMQSIDGNMKVAWRLLHELGPQARIDDGLLVVGSTPLNGDLKLVDDLQEMLGGVATVFQGDVRITTNVLAEDGRRGIGTHLAPGPARIAVLLDGRPFRGLANILGAPYFAGYDPIRDARGQVIGILFVGLKQAEVMDSIAHARHIVLGVSAIAVLLVAATLLTIGLRLSRRIRARERDLEAINLRMDMALESMNQGLCLFDGERRLIVANRRYAEIYQLAPDCVRPGTTLAQIVAHREVAATGPVMSQEEYLTSRYEIATLTTPSDTLTTLRDGRMIAIHHKPMVDGGWVATHDDVTERQAAEARIAFVAGHDDLTGLPNRRLFQRRIDEALTAGRSMTVLYIGLDRFKAVNDGFGHPAGDALLRGVGDRLLGCVRKGDIVARLGGDEFAILETVIGTPEAAAQAARRIIEAISRRYDLGEVQAAVGASIGIVVAAPGRHDLLGEDLLRHADLALEQAKADGGGSYRFFEPAMDDAVRSRRMLEADLQSSLARGEIELYYQPQIDPAGGRLCGFEALMRWHHGARGMISPAEFIPIAEETGMIVALGRWALAQACGEAMHWPADIRVAVNLSPAQFSSPTVVQDVAHALAASGLRPDRLELEITESLLLADSAGTMAALNQMRGLGVRVALDDFGTGYSSLRTLRSFPFDKIKIDQSFIRDLTDGGESLAIVHAVIGLATSLGMTTTAEGVETEEQLALLRAEGCTEVQGYLFSRPVPARELARLLLAELMPA